jgi:hypothetical protein
MKDVQGNQNRSREIWTRMAAGIAIGIGIGVALGAAMENMGAGIAIGIAIGGGIGTTFSQQSLSKRKSHGRTEDEGDGEER